MLWILIGLCALDILFLLIGFWIMRHVMLQKRAGSLHASRELLDAIADNSPAIIYVKDLQGRYILVNRRYEEVFHVRREEMAGKTDYDLFPKESADAFRAVDQGVLAQGTEVQAEEVAPLDEGPHTYVSVKYPLRGADGKFYAVCGISTDITERKRAEEERKMLLASEQEARLRAERMNSTLRRLNSDLEQFTHSAYHDLREPLRMVKIYSQKLQKEYGGKLRPEADLYIRYTVQGANRMEQLVRDLLAYTQVASDTPPPVEAVSAEKALESALSRLKPDRAVSHASVRQGALPQVPVHPGDLEQLFYNLISNSIKYRGDKPPDIDVQAERGNAEWVFSIRDNGIGIDPRYGEQIFGVFKRLHTTEEYPGTGIGLAICRKIVQRYGGRIWVESGPGKGATFFFTVPDRKTSSAAAARST